VDTAGPRRHCVRDGEADLIGDPARTEHVPGSKPAGTTRRTGAVDFAFDRVRDADADTAIENDDRLEDFKA